MLVFYSPRDYETWGLQPLAWSGSRQRDAGAGASFLTSAPSLNAHDHDRRGTLGMIILERQLAARPHGTGVLPLQ